MSDSQYRVILYCSRSDRRLIEQVKADLKNQSTLPDPVLETLFSGQPIVVRQGVPLAEAEHIRVSIEAAGGACEIEPLHRQRSIDSVGFLERRTVQRRHAGDRRRHDRPGAERRRGDRRRNRRRLRYT